MNHSCWGGCHPVDGTLTTVQELSSGGEGCMATAPNSRELRTPAWRQVVLCYSDFCPRGNPSFWVSSTPTHPWVGPSLMKLWAPTLCVLWVGFRCPSPEEKVSQIMGAQLGRHSGRYCESENSSLVLGPGLRLGVDRRPWVDP